MEVGDIISVVLDIRLSKELAIDNLVVVSIVLEEAMAVS